MNSPDSYSNFVLSEKVYLNRKILKKNEKWYVVFN